MVSNLTLMMTAISTASEVPLVKDQPQFFNSVSGTVTFTFQGQWEGPMDLYAYLEFAEKGSFQLDGKDATCVGSRCWGKVRQKVPSTVTMTLTSTAKGMIVAGDLSNQCRGGLFFLTESSEATLTSTEIIPIPGCDEGAPGCYVLGGIERFTDGKITVNTASGTTVIAVRDTANPVESSEVCETGKCEFTKMPAGSMVLLVPLPQTWSHVFTGENKDCAQNLFMIPDTDLMKCVTKIDADDAYKCPSSGGGDTNPPAGEGGDDLPLPAIIGGVVGGVVVIIIVIVIVYFAACRNRNASGAAETTQETASNTSSVVNNNRSNGNNGMAAPAP